MRWEDSISVKTESQKELMMKLTCLMMMMILSPLKLRLISLRISPDQQKMEKGDSLTLIGPQSKTSNQALSQDHWAIFRKMIILNQISDTLNLRDLRISSKNNRKSKGKTTIDSKLAPDLKDQSLIISNNRLKRVIAMVKSFTMAISKETEIPTLDPVLTSLLWRLMQARM